MSAPKSDPESPHTLRKIVDNVSKGALRSKKSVVDFFTSSPSGLNSDAPTALKEEAATGKQLSVATSDDQTPRHSPSKTSISKLTLANESPKDGLATGQDGRSPRTPTKYESGRSSWKKRITGSPGWKMHISPKHGSTEKRGRSPSGQYSNNPAENVPKVNIEIPNSYLGDIEVNNPFIIARHDSRTIQSNLLGKLDCDDNCRASHQPIEPDSRSSPIDIPVSRKTSRSYINPEPVMPTPKLYTFRSSSNLCENFTVGSVKEDPSPLERAANADTFETQERCSSDGHLHLDLRNVQRDKLIDPLPTPLPGTTFPMEDIARSESSDIKTVEAASESKNSEKESEKLSIGSAAVFEDASPFYHHFDQVSKLLELNAKSQMCEFTNTQLDETAQEQENKLLGTNSTDLKAKEDRLSIQNTPLSHLGPDISLHDTREQQSGSKSTTRHHSSNDDLQSTQADGTISPFSLGSPVGSRTGSLKSHRGGSLQHKMDFNLGSHYNILSGTSQHYIETSVQRRGEPNNIEQTAKADDPQLADSSSSSNATASNLILSKQPDSTHESDGVTTEYASEDGIYTRLSAEGEYFEYTPEDDNYTRLLPEEEYFEYSISLSLNADVEISSESATQETNEANTFVFPQPCDGSCMPSDEQNELLGVGTLQPRTNRTRPIPRRYRRTVNRYVPRPRGADRLRSG